MSLTFKKNFALITLIQLLNKEIDPTAPDIIPPDIIPKIQNAVTKY